MKRHSEIILIACSSLNLYLKPYWDSLIAQLVRIRLQCRRPGLIPGSERSTGEGIGYPLQYSWASLVAQLVKNLPAMRETWVQSLDLEDPLEKGKTTHSSILAWRIPWTIKSMGLTNSQTWLFILPCWLLPESATSLKVAKWWFFSSITPFTFVSWHSIIRKNFLSPSCIYSLY